MLRSCPNQDNQDNHREHDKFKSVHVHNLVRGFRWWPVCSTFVQDPVYRLFRILLTAFSPLFLYLSARPGSRFMELIVSDQSPRVRCSRAGVWGTSHGSAHCSHTSTQKPNKPFLSAQTGAQDLTVPTLHGCSIRNRKCGAVL